MLLAGRAMAQGAIAGTVVGADGRPLPSAAVDATRSDRALAFHATADESGAFRISGLEAGIWLVTVRRVGYRSAELPGVRVADGQTRTLSVTLTQAPAQLSTIYVVTSPTSVNAGTPEMATRLDRTFTALLPGARDAASLIALVPGARKDQLWGGAPGVSNSYQLDGVAVNHPGVGGDFLGLSVDWIESLEIRGLGAGAQHGNFQGGVINAVTKSGTNERRFAIRSNYEAAALTASNFNLAELGVEQAGRREVGGEAGGPLLPGRVFYFLGGQYVSRDLRSPDLTTTAPGDFQRTQEQQTDARAIAKLTWLPALGQRVELLGGYSGLAIAHAGINGLDDPSATARVSRPTSYAALSWKNTGNALNQVELRVAGFASRESRTGYAGPGVPGVQLLQPGSKPAQQNAAFDERHDPSSVTATAEWRTRQRVFGEHQLLFGGEVSRGRWRDERIRNGGLTWRPYTTGSVPFDPDDVTTWQAIGSDWGGERRLDSDVASQALYVQDQLNIGTRIAVTPGIRYGHWSGFVRPDCAVAAPCYRFEAVHAEGLDPRLGVAWDVTGRNTFAFKAHWGRYHQGMYSLFFDRAAGADVYSNRRFYYSAPTLTDPRTTFTPTQRDTAGSAFLTYGFDESILNASGRVDRFRQPYVDQTVFAVEKSFGAAWKVEALYTHRANGDIVGLADRNIATNYTPIHGVFVDNAYVRGIVLDANRRPLVLPDVYVSNAALQAYLAEQNALRRFPATVFGYDTGYVRALTWNPDIRLGAVPGARRRYEQLTLTVRTVQPAWRAEASVTGAQLKGNVPGVAGYGTTGTTFSAGPFVNPNEAINSRGYLPDALQMEGKLWVTARLPRRFQAGVLYTHTLGERFGPSFTIEGRYAYSDSALRRIPAQLFRESFGQSVFVEQRGSRHYESRGIVDLHLEWRSPRRASVMMDLFNAFGRNAITLVNTNIGERSASDPTSFFGATRLRTPPRTLRVGLRVD